jgi:hypothetical protein
METIEMHCVSSSNVAEVGYDEDSATLQITFNNGATYQYFDLPQQLFEGLLHAGSVGGYLADHIKGVYRFSKV